MMKPSSSIGQHVRCEHSQHGVHHVQVSLRNITKSYLLLCCECLQHMGCQCDHGGFLICLRFVYRHVLSQVLSSLGHHTLSHLKSRKRPGAHIYENERQIDHGEFKPPVILKENDRFLCCGRSLLSSYGRKHQRGHVGSLKTSCFIL